MSAVDPPVPGQSVTLTGTEWAYWCPLEGTHLVDPDELWVGIVDAHNNALLVAAVVPPLARVQAEGFAAAVRDALAAGPWTRPDGLADWCAAHGVVIDWPLPLSAVSSAPDDDKMSAENERLRAAILDIDAHATPYGEDADGFVDGGYLVTVGALHRALGVVGHTARKCDGCPHDHPALAAVPADDTNVRVCACGHPFADHDRDIGTCDTFGCACDGPSDV